MLCVQKSSEHKNALSIYIYSIKPVPIRTSKLPSPGSALHKDRPSCYIIPGPLHFMGSPVVMCCADLGGPKQQARFHLGNAAYDIHTFLWKSVNMVMLSPSPHPQLTVFDNGQQNLAGGQNSWRYKAPIRFMRVGGHVDDTEPLHSPSRLPRGGTHPAAEFDACSYPSTTYPALD